MKTIEKEKRKKKKVLKVVDVFGRTPNQQIFRAAGSTGSIWGALLTPRVESFFQVSQSSLVNFARFDIAVGIGIIFLATPLGRSIEWLGDEVHSAINLLRPKITTGRTPRNGV